MWLNVQLTLIRIDIGRLHSTCSSLRKSDTQGAVLSLAGQERNKIKITLEPSMMAQRGRRTSALDGGWVINATPRPLFSREKDPVAVLQEVGGPYGPSEWAPKISPHQDSIPGPSSS